MSVQQYILYFNISYYHFSSQLKKITMEMKKKKENNDTSEIMMLLKSSYHYFIKQLVIFSLLFLFQ